MFISKLSIKNFRLFDDTKEHEIKDFNIPNGKDDGSGLTVFVGEIGTILIIFSSFLGVNSPIISLVSSLTFS